MIETICSNERSRVLDIVCVNPDICPDDARFCTEKSDEIIVYKDESGEIVGAGTFRLWGEKKDTADIYLYVLPAQRTGGIGKAMLNALANTPQGKALRFISTKVETNHAQSLEFFENAGFEKWYTEFILRHNGERQPQCDLTFTNYRNEYFEQYVDVLRKSFYTLRQTNDFKPYNCCEPSEAKRAELERQKDNIFILLDGEKIAASVIVNSDSIEDVFVAPGYQGKGLGKKMMCFAINKALDKGASQILLSAIEWNKKALQLYADVGFTIDKRMHYLRLFQ